MWWPSLVDTSKEECCQILRSLELDAFSRMVTVLRAQGHYNAEKKRLLTDVGTALNIPVERHKAEIRRAANDEHLNTIANRLVGPNTMTEWAIEGRRMMSLLPRPNQKTVYTLIADETADVIAMENERLPRPSRTGRTAATATAEFPVTSPASPEASRTTDPTAGSGVLVLPTGTAIQMKRESEEEESERKRSRRYISIATGNAAEQITTVQQANAVVGTTPTGKFTIAATAGAPATAVGSQISMTSRTVTFPGGSTPLKIAMPATPRGVNSNSSNTTISSNPSTAPKQLIIVSSNSVNSGSIQTNVTSPPPSILHKTLSATVPVKNASVKPTLIYGGEKFRAVTAGKIQPPAVAVSQQKTTQQQQQRTVPSNAIATAIKAKHIQGSSNISGGNTFVVQQKTAVTATTRGNAAQASQQQKTVFVQQPSTPGRTSQAQVKTAAAIASVQVKTPQGYANVALRTTSPAVATTAAASLNKPAVAAPATTTVQIKADAATSVAGGATGTGTAVKMLSISGGTKILPKPSQSPQQPLYVVTASSTPLTMVTRTIPATTSSSSPSSSQRVLTGKWAVNSSSGKPLQAVQVATSKRLPVNATAATTLDTATSGSNLVLLQQSQQKTTVGKQSTTPTKDHHVKTVAATKHVKSLPVVTQSQSGNLILLDLGGNQENLTSSGANKNVALAEFLQASGIITSSSGEQTEATTPTKRVLVNKDTKVTPSKKIEESTEKQMEEVIVHEESEIDKIPEENNVVVDHDHNDAAATNKNSSNIKTLSIEEAVEMLNKSDTPATRALLSQAGIQISDEIADSEEEEQPKAAETPPSTTTSTNPQPPSKTSSSTANGNNSSDQQQQQQQQVKQQLSHLTMSTRTRSAMDIYSSTNINLDNFMEEEEEDEPEADDKMTSSENSKSPMKSEQKGVPNPTDTIDVQLSQLTGAVDH